MSETHLLDDQPRNQIESVIWAARHFVRPSDYLRPGTLEAARLHCADRRAEKRLRGLLVAVFLMLMFSSPAMQYADALRAQASVPSATEIQYRALEYSSQREIGPHWGLTEAFTELSRERADRLGYQFAR